MRIKTATTLLTLTMMALFAGSAAAAVLSDEEVLAPVTEDKDVFVSAGDGDDVRTWTSEDGNVIVMKGDCDVETIGGDGENVMVKVVGCGDGDVHKLIQLDGEPVRRTFLGVGLTGLTPELQVHFGSSEGTGIMVSNVVEGSPAEAAGLQAGDVITSINGVAATSVHEGQKAVRKMNEGDTALVEVLRDGSPMSFQAVLTTREFPGCGSFDFDFDFDRMLEGAEGAHKCVIKMLDGDGEFYFDTGNLEESMEKLNEYLEGPEFEALIEKHEADGEAIEKRIEVLEKKVEDIE